MSMPAGWYDDGSGRQRWWDGEKWSEHFAPEAGGAASSHGEHVPAGSLASAPRSTTQVAPVLGFVGLGLAAVGTVLACIPVTFLIGVIVLIAAFVVSLIGLFKKGTAKWPSIVGIVLSIVGGAIGTVVVLVVLASNLAEPPVPTVPTDPTTSAQPTAPPTSDATEERPTPEELAVQFEILAKEGGIVGYEEDPDFYPCMGRFLYDSDLSDESLRLIAQGEDPLDSEREAASDLIVEAGLDCQS